MVRILSGEYRDFRGIVRYLPNGKAEVDVIIFGRLRPVVLDRDDVAPDALPEGLQTMKGSGRITGYAVNRKARLCAG